MVGDRVFMRVSTMNGVMRSRRKAKLSPRCSGLFEILRHIEEVAYEFSLRPTLSGVRPVFYVFMLR